MAYTFFLNLETFNGLTQPSSQSEASQKFFFLNSLIAIVPGQVYTPIIQNYFFLLLDQVAQTINLTWVQPRVLDREQLKTIMGKITTLKDSIVSMETMIENNANEILTV